jgi:serine/threonine protein kinase
MHNNLNELKYQRIISTNTTYGIIWDVEHKGESRALKVVILGSENDKRSGKNLDKTHGFYHSDLKYKKHLTMYKFENEIKNLKRLSSRGLSPDVHFSGIYKDGDISYGYICMDKTDASLKSVIHKRSLKRKETQVIKKLIDKLHNSGYIHNDLKPSNIGIYLDNNDKIYKCLLLDCAKVNNYPNIDIDTFNSKMKRDWDHYFRHTNKNMNSAYKYSS